MIGFYLYGTGRKKDTCFRECTRSAVETKLNHNLNLKIKGYAELWRDRKKNPVGGLAFLIKTPTMKDTEVLLSHTRPTNSETEARAIILDLPGDTVKILNVYHPDTSEIDEDIIKDLCSCPSDLKIILDESQQRPGNPYSEVHFWCTESSQSLHSKRKEKNNCVPYWRDHNIDELMRERDVARHELEKNNSDENRRNLIDISRKVEDEIAACKRSKWIDLCERLDPRKNYPHWRVINVLNTAAINKIMDQPPMLLSLVDIHPRLAARLQT
ncbi:hypothetical protein TNCV_953781 [Trichonephila clavipes]|nr:hypothetical protein TNCV_953781 [Trichonephila clavipes]